MMKHINIMNEEIKATIEKLKELIIEKVGAEITKVYIGIEDNKLEVDYEFRDNHRNINGQLINN